MAADPEHAGQWQRFSQRQSNNGQNVATTYYDALGRPVRATQSGVAGCTQWHYNTAGQVNRVDNADGTVNLFEYDVRGDVSRQALDVNLNGAINEGVDQVTKINRVCTTQDGKNVFQTTTTIVGSAAEGVANYQVIDQQSLDGKWTWHQEANTVSSTETEITPATHTITVETRNADETGKFSIYKDRSLQEVQSRNAKGITDQAATIRYTPDTFGRTHTVKTAFGTTTYWYKANDALNSVVLPDGKKVTGSDLDKYGQAQATALPGGQAVKSPTNTRGQVTSVTTTKTSTTGTSTSTTSVTPVSIGYDAVTGQRTKLTTFRSGTLNGANSAETAFGYDPATGRLASKTYRGAAAPGTTVAPSIVFDYQGSAQLKTITQTGSTATLGYNTAGDVNSISFNSGDLAYSINRDIFGRVKDATRTVDGQPLTTTNTYTSTGRLQQQTQPQAGTDVATSYGYYSTGDLFGPTNTLMSLQLKDGSTVQTSESYTYNPNTQKIEGFTETLGMQTFIHTVDTPAGETPSTTLTTSAAAGGTLLTRVYAYDPTTGRLASLETKIGDCPLYKEEYTEYDDAGRRKTVKVTRYRANEDALFWTTTYTYDGQGRVKDVASTTVGGGPIPDTYHYLYDALGNRTNGSYAVNDLNQYTPAPGSTDTITYDDRGNLTAFNGSSFSYDAQSHLVELVKGALTEKYDYDFWGRRTAKRLYVTNACDPYETDTYAYDGDRLIGEYIQDADHVNPTLWRSYTWGVVPGITGSLLSATDYSSGTPTTYFPIYDGSNNVVGLVLSTSTAASEWRRIAATYQYDPYGKQTESLSASSTPNAAAVCPFRFGSMYYDAETGLYWGGGQRPQYYSPDLQHWLGRNPAGEAADPNLYRFKLVQETGTPTTNPDKGYNPRVAYNYWGLGQSETLGDYAGVIATGATIGIGLTIGIATFGLGFTASGFISGALAGAISGGSAVYVNNGSAGQIAGGALTGAAIGGIAGAAGGAVFGRIVGVSASGMSQAISNGTLTFGRVLAGSAAAGATGGAIEGAYQGYMSTGTLAGTLGAMAQGAVMGGAAGAAMPFVFQGLAAGARSLGTAVRWSLSQAGGALDALAAMDEPGLFMMTMAQRGQASQVRSAAYLRAYNRYAGDEIGGRYQRFVTGKAFEEMWLTPSESSMGVDARTKGFLVEAKWAGRDEVQFATSRNNPAHELFDEAKFVAQARGLLEMNSAMGLRGVRYAVSNQAAREAYISIFEQHFPEAFGDGTLKVFHVPANGMH